MEDGGGVDRFAEQSDNELLHFSVLELISSNACHILLYPVRRDGLVGSGEEEKELGLIDKARVISVGRLEDVNEPLLVHR